MRDDVPEQAGAAVYRDQSGRAGATRSAMRACLTMVLVTVSLPIPARGQDVVDASRAIPVHPSITTILQLPDDVELARFTGPATGMMQATKLRELLYIKPRPGLRAGTEVVLWVKTATMRRRFRLRVVAHAREATKEVLVLGPEPGSAACASAGATDPAPPEPGESVPTGKPDEAPLAIRSRRPEFSMHFVGSFGFAGLDVAGYRPSSARQFHAGLGARLAVTRPGSRWALEANFGGEWPAAPMSFRENNSTRARIELDGPWLRTEVGVRGQLGGTKWNPSLYTGLGAQAHLRQTETKNGTPEASATMPHGAALVLGIGLQRRAGNLLLGLDIQVRAGWPDSYHSMAALWTVGGFLDLDQENEP